MDYEKFLIENEILPIDSGDGKWKHIKIKHVIPQDETGKNDVKEYIEKRKFSILGRESHLRIDCIAIISNRFNPSQVIQKTSVGINFS